MMLTSQIAISSFLILVSDLSQMPISHLLAMDVRVVLIETRTHGVF